MKIFHYLLGLILFLALMAAGLGLLSTAFQGDEVWQRLVQDLSARRVEAILVGVALVFLVLLYTLTALRLPEASQYLAYDIEGGNVSVSLKAVQDFLARLSGEFAAVQALEPAVKARPGAVDVQLDVKVKAGAQIPELCRMLQERARVILREKVGISEVGEVRVRVQEIVGGTQTDTVPGEARPESFS